PFTAAASAKSSSNRWNKLVARPSSPASASVSAPACTISARAASSTAAFDDLRGLGVIELGEVAYGVDFRLLELVLDERQIAEAGIALLERIDEGPRASQIRE